MERVDVVALVRGLSRAKGWGEVLKRLKMTEVEAARVLMRVTARRERRAWGVLSRVQVRLKAQLGAPASVEELRRRLADKRVETRMKAALALLKLAGMDAERGGKKEVRPEEERVSKVAEGMADAVAEVMERKRVQEIGGEMTNDE